MHAFALPRRPSRHPQRVVVIGAGHNGLVCAARLAQAGLEVVVLEQAPKPGGAITSDEAPAGFVHDRCSGFYPLSLASPALRQLPLARHGVEWITPEVAMAHPFLDGGEIVLSRELEATVESLERAAPGSGDSWRRLVGPLVEHAPAVSAAALQRFPPVRAGARTALRLRRDGLEAARAALMAPAALGRELGDAERVGAWIAGTAMHSDLAADQPGGSAFALMLGFLAHVVGWPLVRGGAQRLADGLCALVAERGGTVRCGAAVQRIEAGGRVCGVVADGERLAADAVVSTLSAGALAPLLGDALPPRLMRRLRGWRYGLGTLKVDFALAGPVPWATGAARGAGVVHLGDTLEPVRRAGQDAAAGRFPREPLVVCGQQSLHDDSRAPAGQHTLYAYTRCPSDLGGLAEDEAADVVAARVEAFAPGFGQLVLERVVRSPRRLEAENPSLVGGDLGGGSMALDQQLVFRPAPELFRYRTPLPGLYVCGASTHPGPGVHGASGAGAADALLADRSPLRFWR